MSRLIALLVALVCLPSVCFAEGALRATDAHGSPLGNLPLIHTDVRMDVADGITGVTVTQRFRNGFSQPIEAVYVFPLPVDAAIDAMSMRIGEREIRAAIARREDARETYDAARAQGQRTALLEQERPNIFTMRVANLTTGGDILVTTHFFGRARYDHGAWELAFPMVVGPRYIPGDPLPGPASGTGAHPDTDRVTDASRISPGYVLPGTRAGHAITLTANLDAGSSLREVASPSHEIAVSATDPARITVALRDKDEIPNRDFVLRWRTAEARLGTRVLTHRTSANDPGYLSLTLEARTDVPAAEVAPRELVFLLDTSGSMQGAPLDAVKRAIRRALRAMAPHDTFTLIDFADRASAFSPRPLPNTPANVARALGYLEHLQASGGTNQLDGIHAALSLPGDAMRLRYVVFMTDGYIGNEGEVMALTHREIGQARIFSFGVGAAVNRYLLDEVAEAGRGVAEYLRPDEDPDAMVERFYQRIGQPWITDLAIDWGDGVRDALPNPLPDLSGLQPVRALARFTAVGARVITLRGRIAGRAFSQEVPVQLPAVEPRNAALSSVWARETVGDLERTAHYQQNPESARDAITRLALAHHLVSAFTSFVAVDTSERVGNGAPRTVNQPLDGPQGVNLGAAGGSIGDAFGYGGLGATGQGWGGGGAGAGTLGMGSVGTLGHGTGHGYGTGMGRGLRERASSVLLRATTPTVSGSLNTDLIRRVVQRNLGQVRRCYEIALRANPALTGRLVPRFVIDAQGRVVGVQFTVNTLNDPSVAACVEAALRRWIFPAPGSGGMVTVSYPMNFAPGL
ncbi:MAG: VIT domain-containing protein [Polyangiales bacterium]